MRTLAGNVSVGRLMEFLTALGQDVKIAGTSRRGKSRGRWKWWGKITVPEVVTRRNYNTVSELRL
jgi:hypothetical protein